MIILTGEKPFFSFSVFPEWSQEESENPQIKKEQEGEQLNGLKPKYSQLYECQTQKNIKTESLASSLATQLKTETDGEDHCQILS